ncbi:MAG: hypothetical protein U1F65_03530 [Verrucomicrobiota bacterium]
MSFPHLSSLPLNRVRCRFRQWTLLLLFAIAASASHAQTNEPRSLVLVIGAAGEADYGEQFNAAAQAWSAAAQRGGMQLTVIGDRPEASPGDGMQLQETLTNESARAAGELWLVLIGHGTFDGKSAKFNLRGPDLSADVLAAWLKPPKRPLAVVVCASASGAFLKPLSGTTRVVVTATRSGNELNISRFGTHLAQAIGNPEADLDKDGQTSLLEAYLMASRQVEQFYRDAGRLMTEHALLDDTGDGLGTPADWFTGVRATRTAANGKSVDGVRAHQFNLIRSADESALSPTARMRRDELERQLSGLVLQKPKLGEEDYYRRLEPLLLEMARLSAAP